MILLVSRLYMYIHAIEVYINTRTLRVHVARLWLLLSTVIEFILKCHIQLLYFDRKEGICRIKKQNVLKSLKP